MINNVQDYINELRNKLHDFIEQAERGKRRNDDPNAKGSIRMVYYYQGQIDMLNILLATIDYIGISLDDLIN